MAGTVYNDKEGQAEAMAKLTEALVSGSGLSDIEFENEKSSTDCFDSLKK